MSERVSVLICDDHPHQVNLLKRELSDLGYDVAGTAMNGQEAIDQTVSLTPDVVLMDIRMPILDGIEATRRIMERAPTAIVMLTALADRSMVQAALEAGASAYLTKPVDEAQLTATMTLARQRFAEFQELRTEVSALHSALEARKVIEKAKGVIMRQINLEAEAFRRLRKLSLDKKIPIHEAARRIVEGLEEAPQD